MAKLTKKEKEKLEKQCTSFERGETWVGIRPVVYKNRRKDTKSIRREGKKLSKDF